MKNKPAKILFIFNNLLLNVFVNGLVWLLIYSITNKSIITANIVVSSYLILVGIAMILLSFRTNAFIEGTKCDENGTLLKPFLARVHEKGFVVPPRLSFIRIKGTNTIPSPAFALLMENKIYIERNLENHMGYLGILGHELGHVMSGFARLLSLRLFRINVIIGNYLLVVLRGLFPKIMVMNKEKKMFFKKILFNTSFLFLFIMYYVLTFLEQLLIMPFIRQDELRADYFTVELGYGEALRTVLFQYTKNNLYGPFEYFMHKFLDLEHPTSQKRIELLNQYLQINDALKAFYYCDNTLHYLDYNKLKECEKLVLPSHINEIKRTAFIKNHFKEIDLTNASSIENGCFSHSSSLVKIRLGKLQKIPPLAFAENTFLYEVSGNEVNEIATLAFNNCHQLKKLEVPNLNIIEGTPFKGCQSLAIVVFYQKCYYGLYDIEKTIMHSKNFDPLNDYVNVCFEQKIDINLSYQGVVEKWQVSYNITDKGISFNQHHDHYVISVQGQHLVVKNIKLGINFILMGRKTW